MSQRWGVSKCHLTSNFIFHLIHLNIAVWKMLCKSIGNHTFDAIFASVSSLSLSIGIALQTKFLILSETKSILKFQKTFSRKSENLNFNEDFFLKCVIMYVFGVLFVFTGPAYRISNNNLEQSRTESLNYPPGRSWSYYLQYTCLLPSPSHAVPRTLLFTYICRRIHASTMEIVESRCAMVFGGVVSRDGLGLGRIIGAPGYRANRSVAMAPMFKGIRFGKHHICSEVWEVVS